MPHVPLRSSPLPKGVDDGPLERIVALAPPGRVAAALDLRRRFSGPRLRVLVAGEAKRGKSTLINRLLATDLLPTGAVPVTAVATTVLPIAEGVGHLEVDFLDARTERRPLADLASLVTEALNPGNIAGVREVRVTVPTATVGSAVELVDTPGTGSVWQHNTDAATAAFASLDAVIVVLAADPPASRADVDLLAALQAESLRTFVFVNKLDRVHGVDRTDVETFTRQVCTGTGLAAEQVWFGSAREPDDGFDGFCHAFLHYVDSRAAVDAGRALARHARRLLNTLLGDAELEVTVLDTAHTAGADRARDLAARVRAIRGDAERLDAECTATEVALHDELNLTAGRLQASVVAEVVQALHRTHHDADEGRRLVEELTTPAVLAWRAQQQTHLEARLTELRGTVASRVAAQLTSLSADALDLLGVRLGASPPDFDLPAVASPVFDYQPGPRWEGPTAGLLREHAPGASRRAGARLLADVPRLVDRQVGRARADLQRVLEEAVRGLRRRLVVEHSERLDELVEILSRAQLDVVRHREDTAARRRLLADRIEQLHAIGQELSRLERTADPGPGLRADLSDAYSAEAGSTTHDGESA